MAGDQKLDGFGSDARPPGLSAEASLVWDQITGEYALDPAGLKSLQLACEALTLLRRLEAEVDADGFQTVDRFGQKKPHPLLAECRLEREAIRRHLHDLGLDLEPIRPGPGRPPVR